MSSNIEDVLTAINASFDAAGLTPSMGAGPGLRAVQDQSIVKVSIDALDLEPRAGRGLEHGDALITGLLVFSLAPASSDVEGNLLARYRIVVMGQTAALYLDNSGVVRASIDRIRVLPAKVEFNVKLASNGVSKALDDSFFAGRA